MMITIIDYGVGNILSIQNMFKKAGIDAQAASDKLSIEKADKLVLPGIGAFDTCAEKLRQSGLYDILQERVIEYKIPVLGICAGMQLMTERSEEGILPGLGWIKASTVKFKTTLRADLKIPHMGWAEIVLNRPSPLFTDLDDEPRFYFVHSYHTVLEDKKHEIASAEYGSCFTAAFEHDNIIGVQFHPEKSHKFGMKLLENFIKYY